MEVANSSEVPRIKQQSQSQCQCVNNVTSSVNAGAQARSDRPTIWYLPQLKNCLWLCLKSKIHCLKRRKLRGKSATVCELPLFRARTVILKGVATVTKVVEYIYILGPVYTFSITDQISLLLRSHQQCRLDEVLYRNHTD